MRTDKEIDNAFKPDGITDNRMEWAVKNNCNPIQVAHIMWMKEDQAIMNIELHNKSN